MMSSNGVPIQEISGAVGRKSELVTFCMPCMADSSETVSLGPLFAGQSATMA